MQHLLRDPVHHTVPLSRTEKNLIDHPLFQRLRRIKQTAFLNLVFPGSTHDRFSHCVGAMHLAGLIFDSVSQEFINTFGPRALQPPQQDYFRRLLRMAALMHDIGHGPFSHSLEGVTRLGRPLHPQRKLLFREGVIPEDWVHDKFLKSEKWMNEATSHEDFTIAILSLMSSEEEGRIGGLMAQDIACLIVDWARPSPEFMEVDQVGPSGKWKLHDALKELVSGELDADRMDYLLRDSHNTGVPYGQYDKEMLIGNVLWRPHPDKKGQLVTALRRKALHAFEDFLISRFHMFMQLYSHKTTVAFDVILENALAELPDFSIQPDLTDYLRWSDDWLLRKIIENRSSKWGEHIRDRIPLKHLFTMRQDQQKKFLKLIEPFERSHGTTAWFPSLKNKPEKDRNSDVPKIWWRHSVSYLTKKDRGRYPLYIEDKNRLIPIEEISLLLKSDYVRRFDMIHVYCLRGQEYEVKKWMKEHGMLPPDEERSDLDI